MEKETLTTPETTEETQKETRAKTTKAAKPPRVVATYAIADFAEKARTQYGVPPEAVTAALRSAGREKYSVEEAKTIVTEFLNREVK